jgi:hypothetical protein
VRPSCRYGPTICQEAGFTEDPLGETEEDGLALHHPAALLSRVHPMPTAAGCPVTLAIGVERLVDFMAALRLSREPEGAPWSRFRRLVVSEENGAWFAAVERRGYRSADSGPPGGLTRIIGIDRSASSPRSH